MCGIAGQFSINGVSNLNNKVDELKQMLSAIKHRGPDDQGILIENRIIMGMRRLSIIDVSTGQQPILNEDKTVMVVFNGEIYNYIELRNMLKDMGHIFYTNSDTEVLVHLYEEYGENISHYLNGMFAYAIWDSKKEVLILSRDRVGEKPLYYTVKGDILYFASEIKSLIQCEGIERCIDMESINQLLTFNYVLYPKTAFKDINRVEPGRTLVYSNGDVKHIKYWEIPKASSQHIDENVGEYLNNLIINSTEIRLRSDVEVGTFLSGGIDSTLIAKCFCNNTRRKFKVFSIGFKEENFDELEYAKIVATKYGAEHIYEVLRSDNFMEKLVNSIWYSENPHGDISFVPTHDVSSLASRYLKVVLTGDGGDEIFGGYDKYLNYKYDKSISIDDNFKRYLEENSVFSPVEKDTIFSKSFKDNISCDGEIDRIVTAYKEIHKNDFINKIMYFDTDYLLEGNNLVKPDRMGMANSIEARYPLLDYRIIDFMFSLKSNEKIVNGNKKKLLKDILKEEFDSDFINRKKQMFTVPIGEWLKQNDFKNCVEGIFKSEKFVERGIFDQGRVIKMLDDHSRGNKNFTREIRLILIIEMWCRIFIDELYLEKPSFFELL